MTGVGEEALVERKTHTGVVATVVWVLPTRQGGEIRLKWSKSVGGTEECATGSTCVKLPLMAELKADYHFSMPLINMVETGVSVIQPVENTYSVMTTNPSTMLAEKQHVMDYHGTFTSDGSKQRIDADRDAQTLKSQGEASQRRDERNEKLMYAAVKNAYGYGMNIGAKLVESAQDKEYLDTMRSTFAGKPASDHFKKLSELLKEPVVVLRKEAESKREYQCEDYCTPVHTFGPVHTIGHGMINANDGVCDDGGAGSSFAYCKYGTDCHDCGQRVTLTTQRTILATTNICNHLEAGPGIKLAPRDDKAGDGKNLNLWGTIGTVAGAIGGATGAAWHEFRTAVGMNDGWTGSCDAHGDGTAAIDYTCGHVEIALDTNLINLRGYFSFTPHRFFGAQMGVMIATKSGDDLVLYYEASQMNYVHMDPAVDASKNAASPPVLWVGPIHGMPPPNPDVDGRTDKYIDAWHKDGVDKAKYNKNRAHIKKELNELAAIPIDYKLFWEPPGYICDAKTKLKEVEDSFAGSIGYFQTAKDIIASAHASLKLTGAVSKSVVCGTNYLKPAGGVNLARQGSGGFELAEMAVWGHFIAESNPLKAAQTTTARFWDSIY